MKILRKLTRKNLTMNRTRTMVTIIGIILSTALITVVACMATSFQQSMINVEILNSGNYDFSVTGNCTKDNIEKIKANRNIDNVYYQKSVGIGKFESKSKFKPFVYINSYSKNAFNGCFKTELKEGRLPENSNEIVLSPMFVKHSKVTYIIGDTVTFKIGERIGIDTGTVDGGEYVVSPNEEYYFDKEKFIDKSEKTYTIVGIFSETKGDLVSYENSACANVYTIADLSTEKNESWVENTVFVDIKESEEKNYNEVMAEVFGLSADQMTHLLSNQCSDDEYSKIEKTIKDNGFDFNDISINHDLLAYKGYSLSDQNNSIMINLIILVISVIVLSSVFIIRNSFEISITEKTKLYGMLSSVGTTPRQIRHNVLYEGFVLGLIGIPLGIIIGVGVAYLLVILCNVILAELLDGAVFVYKISFIAIIISIIMGMVTIFFSSLSSSIRASKIPPIEAIRSSNDVKIKKKKNKSYKTPRIITKLFGVGGSIAWKNLKRNRKKYRTTVISIVVSVAVFISVYSFVQYGVNYSTKYLKDIKYNMSIYSNQNISPSKKDYDEYIDNLTKIYESEYVTDYLMIQYCYYYNFKFDKNVISDSIVSGDIDYYSITVDGNDLYYNPTILLLDDANYKKILKKIGKSYEEMKDKAIFVNLISKQNDSDSEGQDKSNYEKVIKNPVGMTITGENTYDEQDANDKKYSKVKITIGAEITDVNMIDSGSAVNDSALNAGDIIVSKDWYDNNINYKQSLQRLSVNSSDTDKTEQFITDLDNQNIFLMNFDKEARQMKSLLLVVQIFVYGFIIVISLIGVTNIFNTITTNMRLRRKEFAMLRSVGMTNKEFKRMVNLESIFYTVKALLIGIPLGILGSVLTYNIFANNESTTKYIFPFVAVLIAIVAVMGIVWMIMRFSIAKIKNQNIIETIRNDNV